MGNRIILKKINDKSIEEHFAPLEHSNKKGCLESESAFLILSFKNKELSSLLFVLFSILFTLSPKLYWPIFQLSILEQQ